MDCEYIDAKSIITTTKKPNYWFGTHYNMNIYKGCSHGCIYCDSRSDCYGIDNFDCIKVKKDALRIIRDDLRRKTKTGVIATGAMSDPYNPIENELLLTRKALELINAFGFGVSIATKSTLLSRDIDILTDIKSHSPVICKVTITTADDELSKKIEPGASSSYERFDLLRNLSDNKIFSGILLMPVLPFIEDSEENIVEIVRLANESGVKFIYPAFGVTLRANQREWFYNKLDTLFPGQRLKEKYIETYKNSYNCRNKNASRLWKVFQSECDKYNILYKMEDIISAYNKPYRIEQLRLFDTE
ncbi:MAG: radical SAM protein [Suipraeoptans sp.]